MHSQTEVKCKLQDMANSNMHSKKKLFKVDNTSKNNVNINVNKQKKQRILPKKLQASYRIVKIAF